MGKIHETLNWGDQEQPGTDRFGREPASRDRLFERISFPQPAMNQPAPLSLESGVDPRLVTLLDDQSLGAEQFRVLSARLRNLRGPQTLKRILVTSSVVGEGKSVIAANLAVSLARDGTQNVLLVGGDLRCLALNRLFGYNGLCGLTQYLQANERFSNCLYPVGSLTLRFLPAGEISLQTMPLLQSPRLKELLEMVSASFDWIIIDSPPLLPLADANVWARLVDGILLVVREGKTPRQHLGQALDRLDRVPLLGVVVNGCKHLSSQHYKYW
jgi:capsular exopolysaccharide synthesis family protein